MKTAPYKLAFFGILITVLRIAMLIAVIDGGFGAMLSKLFAGAFAVFIAVGVYVSSFFVRHEKTRWAGGAGLFLFGFADLWFNEATVVYYTSSAQLIAPTSNFLGIGAGYLTYIMQATALGFGGLPTLGAAVLGWMQSGAAQVAELNRVGLAGRISAALGKAVTGWGIGIAIKLEGGKRNAERPSQYSPNNDGGNGTAIVRRWSSLTAAEGAKLPQMSRGQIMALFGISDGAAGEWLRRLRSGEKPWLKSGVDVR